MGRAILLGFSSRVILNSRNKNYAIEAEMFQNAYPLLI
jgi:hypothetical protein